MFRGRRRHHGGRRPRRSVDWGGAFWFGENVSFPAVSDFGDFNSYTVAAFWVLWPRGQPDPDNNGLVPEPDDTLVRTLSNLAWTNAVPTTPSANRPHGVIGGLIKWASIDPDPAAQLVIGGWPNPFDSHLDWVWRNVTPHTTINTTAGQGQTELSIQSRAQRRFREGEGLLAVIAAMDFSILSETSNLSWMWDIRCAAKKAV